MSKKRLNVCEAEHCENTSSNCDLTFFKMPKDSVGDSSALIGKLSSSVKRGIDDHEEMNKRHCPEMQDNGCNSIIDVTSPIYGKQTTTLSSPTSYSRSNEIWSIVNQLNARNAEESSYKELVSHNHKLVESVTEMTNSNIYNQNPSEITSKCNKYEGAEISFQFSNVKNDLLKSQAKLFEYTQQVFNLENALRKKDDELEALKERLKDKEEQCNSYCKQIEELSSHVTNRTNDCKQQNQKILKLKRENKSLKRKLLQYKRKLHNKPFLRTLCSKLERKIKLKHLFEQKRLKFKGERSEKIPTSADEKEKVKLLVDFLKEIEEKNAFFAALDLQPKISVNKDMTDKFLYQLNPSQYVSDISYFDQNYAQNSGNVQEALFSNDLPNDICLTFTPLTNENVTFQHTGLGNESCAFVKPAHESCDLADKHKLGENMALSYALINESYYPNNLVSNAATFFPSVTSKENVFDLQEKTDVCDILNETANMIVLDSYSQNSHLLQDEKIEISTLNFSPSSLDLRLKARMLI